MALELGQFINDLLKQNAGGADASFLKGIWKIVHAYLGERGERNEQTGSVMPNIPYDVGAKDATVVSFIAGLNLPIRIKSALVRHVALSEDYDVGDAMRVESISDLYNLNNLGLGDMVRNIGKKGKMAINQSLEGVLDGREKLIVGEKQFFIDKKRLMETFGMIKNTIRKRHRLEMINRDVKLDITAQWLK